MGDVDRFLAWCPEKDRDSLMEARRERWEFLGGQFPVPRGDWPTCFVCGHDQLHYSHVGYTKRGHSTLDYRAEVQMKCTSCSAKIQFGIPITPEEYDRWNVRRQFVRWREIEDRLRGDN